MGMKLSECGRFWLPAQESAYPDKEAERQELHSHIEDFLARGGSIERLSHTDFATKEATLNEEQYREMFKRNLSFGNRTKVRFNGRIRRGASGE